MSLSATYLLLTLEPADTNDTGQIDHGQELQPALPHRPAAPLQYEDATANLAGKRAHAGERHHGGNRGLC